MSKKTDKCDSFTGRKRSVRNKIIAKNILDGKSIKSAMIAAGYSAETARCKSGKKMREIAPTIQALMEKRGLSDNRLLEVLENGLQSKITKTASIDGKITDERVYEDRATQHKYLETGLKLKGHLREKIDLSIVDNLSERLRDARERTKKRS